MSDKMREEFEAFRDKRNAVLEAVGHAPGSKWHVTSAHYPTWEASRAAVVVELPSDQCIKIHNYSPFEVNDFCAQAIEAAGLKVKP